MPHRTAIGVLLTVLLSASSASLQQGASARLWPTTGGDHANTKYAPLDQIDRDAVDRLRVVWRWTSPDHDIVTANRTTLPSQPTAFKATPILADRVLYIKTSPSQPAAIDAATGETLWVFDPGTWEGERPANMGYNASGVAYWSVSGHPEVSQPEWPDVLAPSCVRVYHGRSWTTAESAGRRIR